VSQSGQTHESATPSQPGIESQKPEMQRPVIAQSEQSQSSPFWGSHVPSGAPLHVPSDPLDDEATALLELEADAFELDADEVVVPPVTPDSESPQLTAAAVAADNITMTETIRRVRIPRRYALPGSAESTSRRHQRT
jgi:hypothetical protein